MTDWTDFTNNIPPHNGWKASREYHGAILFTHPDVPVAIYATPDYHRDGEVPIDIIDPHGVVLESHNREWPTAGRTADSYLALVRPFLDAWGPKDIEP